MTERQCKVCPGCGYNLTRETPVSFGGLDYDPAGDVHWKGAFVRLSPSEHIILGSLVHAGGAIIPYYVLNERIGYEGDGNVVDVFLSRLRRRLRNAGAPPDLIQNVRRRGQRLNMDVLRSSAP